MKIYYNLHVFIVIFKNFQMKTNKGFTLIELLVVIAIIGILSSVVVASLNIARAKGADTAIKSNLNTVRTQSSIFFDQSGNTYGADATTCADAGSLFVEPTIAAAIVNAQNSSGGTATCFADDGVANVGPAATSWAVSLTLKTNPLESWCVDSLGNAASGTATLVADLAVCQ